MNYIDSEEHCPKCEKRHEQDTEQAKGEIIMATIALTLGFICFGIPLAIAFIMEIR